MQNFLTVFTAIGLVLNLCGLIWVAAVKVTRIEVKVEPMWKWFLRFRPRDNEGDFDDTDYK